jgi:hypothetical protein
LWFTTKAPTAAVTAELDRLYQLVDSQSRLIFTLESALARATNQPPPAPWLPHSRPLLPSSPSPNSKAYLSSRIRGAEAVSTMDREARRKEEETTVVQETFKLPAYMEKQTRAIPPEQVPPGKSVGGGFSPLQSEPPQDKSPSSDSPSTAS